MIYPHIPEPRVNPPEPSEERDPYWYDEAREEEMVSRIRMTMARREELRRAAFDETEGVR